MRARTLSAVLLLIGLSAAFPSADWPMHGYSATRNGFSGNPGPIAADVKWTFDFRISIYGGPWDNVRLQDNASPIVGPDNTIYQITEDSLYAINPDGTLKWNTEFWDDVNGRLAPALSPDGSRIYAPTRLSGGANAIIALDTDDGTSAWEYQLAPWPDADMSYSSLAVDAAGVIYVGTRSPATLFAINPNGTLKWSYTYPNSDLIGIEAPPAVGPDGSVYCIVNTVGLVALDQNGAFQWSRNHNSGGYGWPTPAVLADGTIVIAGDPSRNSIIAYNPDGSTKWERVDIGGSGGYFSGVAVSADQGTVYTARQGGRMYALNSQTGATRWFSVPAAGDELAGSPVLASNGIIYMMGSEGYVYAIAEPNGSLLWSYQLNTPAFYWGPSSPAIGNDGTLYAAAPGTVPAYGDIPGRLYAFKSSGTGAADFDGDGKSDVLWRHETRGDVWLWPMNGPSRTAETYVRTVADTNWEIRGLGDQTGDGKADILWRNKTTGAIYFWPMNGSTPLSETYVATVDPAYDIVGTGDFNRDGKSDILWRHLTNGEVWVWLMDGATPLNQIWVGTVDPAYVIKGVGDLDGDGRADIVWHHGTVGEVWVWLMDGVTPLSRTWVATVPDVGYQIQGVADFTGDGKADILWHHATTGEVWLWRMDGTTRLAETWVGTVPDTNYRIVNAGDYDGDQKADILWHHATLGEVWVWLMDGATRRSQTWVATVPEVGYQIVKVK